MRSLHPNRTKAVYRVAEVRMLRVRGRVASATFGEPVHDTMVEACEKAEGVPSGGTCERESGS